MQKGDERKDKWMDGWMHRCHVLFMAFVLVAGEEGEQEEQSRMTVGTCKKDSLVLFTVTSK